MPSKACLEAVSKVSNMDIRKVLKFNGTLGMTLPNKYTKVLDLHWGHYVEIYLADKETIVVRKHAVPKSKKGDYGDTEYQPSTTT